MTGPGHPGAHAGLDSLDGTATPPRRRPPPADALSPGDLDVTLGRITAAAVEVLPDVQFASITIKHGDGSLETVAPTDEVLREVDAAQYEPQEGPCYEAAADTVPITAPDLAADPRFPRYAPTAVAKGIHAQAGIRLFVDQRVQRRPQPLLRAGSARSGTWASSVSCSRTSRRSRSTTPARSPTCRRRSTAAG